MIQRIERKLRSWLTAFRAWWYRRQDKVLVHFLHIGKTGGTAVKYALRDVAVGDSRIILLHQHHVRLRDIPVGEKLFFFLRDPVQRFVSGFLSRQRMGHPQYHVPWTRWERLAFERFHSPEQLALALDSPDSQLREQAREAMFRIGHVRTAFRDWFESEAYLEERKSDILFIGYQETLGRGFQRLSTILGLTQHVRLPLEPDRSNRNPSRCDAPLSPRAQTILKAWYKEEYRFLSAVQRLFPEFHETE